MYTIWHIDICEITYSNTHVKNNNGRKFVKVDNSIYNCSVNKLNGIVPDDDFYNNSISLLS